MPSDPIAKLNAVLGLLCNPCAHKYGTDG